jgi:hypothetical protein
VKRGTIPHFHSLRHSAASWAIANGESVEEVPWQLGHKSSPVTRAVYVHEVKRGERVARRRARMEAQFGSVLEASGGSSTQQGATSEGAEVLDLRQVAADGEVPAEARPLLIKKRSQVRVLDRPLVTGTAPSSARRWPARRQTAVR